MLPMYFLFYFVMLSESAWNLSRLSIETIGIPVQLLLEGVALLLLFSRPASKWYLAAKG